MIGEGPGGVLVTEAKVTLSVGDGNAFTVVGVVVIAAAGLGAKVLHALTRSVAVTQETILKEDTQITARRPAANRMARSCSRPAPRSNLAD